MQAFGTPVSDLLTDCSRFEPRSDTVVTPGSSWLLPKLLTAQPQFSVHDSQSSERPQVEAYIAQRFEQEYGAKLYQFLPKLIVMQCGLSRHEAGDKDEKHCVGLYSAAVGVSSAKDHDLFLEQYLDRAIEVQIGAKAKALVERKDIVEIGNLAASRRGSSRILFVVLASALAQAGYTWVTFTATKQVASIFSKLQCETFCLGEADSSRLGRKIEHWGSYYDNKPQLMAVNLASALEHSRENWLQSAALHLFHSRAQALAAKI